MRPDTAYLTSQDTKHPLAVLPFLAFERPVRLSCTGFNDLDLESAPQLDEICNCLFDPATKLVSSQLRELMVA